MSEGAFEGVSEVEWVFVSAAGALLADRGADGGSR
jgi:hypothetical protein